MKRLILLYTLLFAVFLTPCAQELEVVSMEPTNDISWGDDQRYDVNGVKCALIKVQLPLDDVEFKGNIIGDVPFKINEYWVYMSKGSRMLKVQCRGYYTLMVNFGDYGINEVGSQCVYYLKIRPKGNQTQSNDLGSNYVVFKVSPANANAIVMVDGTNMVELDAEGNGKTPLKYGNHSYSVEARGYATATGTVSVTADKATVCPVTLRSEKAKVTVNAQMQGTAIYVNDAFKAQDRWAGELFPNSYLIEGRKEGYRTETINVTLSKNDDRTITIPALQAIKGNLDVDYDPIGSKIEIDGKQMGETPTIFNNLVVGSHKVTISKDGYKPVTQTVTIREGETANLQGALEKAAVQTASNASASASGDRLHFTAGGVGFDMIFVKGGTFQMGATPEQGSDAYDDEKPVHSVTLSDYYIGETEVTQALWQAVMGSNPSSFEGDNLPVETVSWKDCQNFIRKLNDMTGQEFCLPTEAQWEYAARGGSKSLGYKYSGSNDLGSVAWYKDNSSDKTHPVKTKTANELGIYDMSGNVWEWCQDYYGDYSSDSQTEPTGPKGGSYHVFRGGSWSNIAGHCRSSNRDYWSPGDHYDYLGLRLAIRVRRL